MAIIRQRRQAAISALYTTAALVYLILGTIVAGSAFIPGTIPAITGASLSPIEKLAPLVFVLVATMVIWRGLRKLSALIMLATLYQALVSFLDAMGTHFQVRTEKVLPPLRSWTDPQVLQSFVKGELGTGTPFYHTSPVTATTPVSLTDALARLPLPEGVAQSVPAYSLAPAYLSLLNGLLLLVMAFMIWRAVRYPK